MTQPQPTSGGTYLRDPETGALTLVQPPTAWAKPEAEVTLTNVEPETVPSADPKTPAAPAKKGGK